MLKKSWTFKVERQIRISPTVIQLVTVFTSPKSYPLARTARSVGRAAREIVKMNEAKGAELIVLCYPIYK